MRVHRNSLVNHARSLLGVPFRHQGRDRAGLDCVGQLFYVAWQVGFDTPDFQAYDRRPDGKTMLEQLTARLERLPSPRDARPGDVLVFAWAGWTSHCAIVAVDPDAGVRTMIHAYLPNRKVVEHYIDETWWDRAVAAFSFPGVEG